MLKPSVVPRESAMAQGIVYLVFSLVTLLVSGAQYPREPERCAGFEYVDVSRLPRFNPRITARRMHSTMILRRSGSPSHPNTKFIQEYKMVNGTTTFVNNEVGRLPGAKECRYRQFQAMPKRAPNNPCLSSRLIIPPGSTRGEREMLLYSPDRNTVMITFCRERINKICTQGLICVTTREVELSPKRRNQLLYKLEKLGFLKEFGATRADMRPEDTRLNDCEFPADVLERLEQRERSNRRRKVYRY